MLGRKRGQKRYRVGMMVSHEQESCRPANRWEQSGGLMDEEEEEEEGVETAGPTFTAFEAKN